MAFIRELASSVRDAIRELARPGESQLSGPELADMGRVAVTLAVVVTNLIGAFAVIAIANFVLPVPALQHIRHVQLVNLVTAGAYLAFAVPAGLLIGTRGMQRLRTWLLEDRPATLEEARVVLRAPLRLSAMQVSLWIGAAIVFGIVDLSFSGALAIRVVGAILITGLVTASCAYLLTELLLRPAAARALAQRPSEKLVVPGVATRAVLAWFLGTGLPIFGLVSIGIEALAGDHTASRHQLAIAIVSLGGVGIAVGLLAVTVAARATADPVDSVRRALAEVQEGNLDVRVPVYDGTQIGQLQLGFNEMVAGLAERERIREAFGTYVDPDVAKHVLEEGTDAGGEELEVTLMFLDIRDFTGFAEGHAATEVVAALNELFEQIVPIIHEHGGRVDKFIGDGLLAVFGAPRRQPDHAAQALQAAREIAKNISSSEQLELGIGLNSGTVVVGNVGGAGRLEFSVIGDAVNIAARVEAATRETGDAILVAERTKELLDGDGPELVERSGVELRGRREPVRVFAPAN